MSVPDWMSTQRRRERARSFGPAAKLYDQVRPSYPPAAIGWALAPLGPGRQRVVDLGAGTGIMTRQLTELGHEVVAVEPDHQMRDRLHQTSPQAWVVGASAESIPLAASSVDAAVAAQSYHWFHRDRVHAQLARVVRAGGVVAAIWNDRDESAPWVAEYSRIVEGDRGPDGSGADSGRTMLTFGESFGPTELREFHHSVPYTPAMLVALLQSRSYYLTASALRRAALASQVHGLARSHPDLAGRDSFDLPYVTSVYRAGHR